MNLGVSIICIAQITQSDVLKKSKNNTLEYFIEQFSDIKVVRYQILGLGNLTLKDQKLVYYLTPAGYSGRDITCDQHYKNNLKIFKELEHIFVNSKGNKTSKDCRNFEISLK